MLQPVCANSVTKTNFFALPCMQRLPRGVVLRHRLLARRLAGGRAPPRVQGAGRGTAGGHGGAAGSQKCSSRGRAAGAVTMHVLWTEIDALLVAHPPCQVTGSHPDRRAFKPACRERQGSGSGRAVAQRGAAGGARPATVRHKLHGPEPHISQRVCSLLTPPACRRPRAKAPLRATNGGGSLPAGAPGCLV